jgi:N-methylhydantoinase B
MNVYLASERVKHPCFGVAEGEPGRKGYVFKDGAPAFPKGKIVLQPGERLTVETSGGGGWGRPAERPRALIESDLREGLVTCEAAAEHYGYRAA